MMKPEFDTIKYMMLPYKNKGRDMNGVDCWGLVRMIYQDEFDIVLPSMGGAYDNASDGAVVREVIAFGKPLMKAKEKDAPDYGDMIVFNIKGNPCHVGIYIGHNRVLHILKGTNSVCERLNSGRLKGRVEGYYEVGEQD